MTGAGPALAARMLPLRLLTVAVIAAAVVGAAGGVALHRLRLPATPAGAALPDLHGQAVWAPGERRAPAFAMRDERGAVVSLRALRGRPVLLTFLGSRCGGCTAEARRIASVLRRLPATARPTLVVVSVDPGGDTPAAIGRAVRRWGLAGAWHWHWLTASTARLAPLWRAYGIADGSPPRLRSFLIDSRGDERTAYLFPFLPAFVEGDLARLAGERT